MDYAGLIAEFGANYGMDGLAPDENGAVGFEVDGRPFAIQIMPESESVVATVELGAEIEATAVNRLMMRTNQSLFMLEGMAIVLHPATSHYCLMIRFDITALDYAGFDAKIGHLLERAEQWAKFFENYRPVAGEAAANRVNNPEPAESEIPFADMLRV